jgi:hypothetical protein
MARTCRRREGVPQRVNLTPGRGGPMHSYSTFFFIHACCAGVRCRWITVLAGALLRVKWSWSLLKHGQAWAVGWGDSAKSLI